MPHVFCPTLPRFSGARIVQLGDLGHPQHGSGGSTCFAFAKAYLDGFGVPAALVIGNHDLEGAGSEQGTRVGCGRRYM